MAVAADDDLQLGAEDRFDAELLRRLVERDRTEHVSVIGEGYRGHALLLDLLDEVLHLHRAVQHRVLGVDVEMDEVGGHEGAHRVAGATPGREPEKDVSLQARDAQPFGAR